MGFAATVDSFIKLLDSAPKPPADGKRAVPKQVLKPLKVSTNTPKGEKKTATFKLPAHAVKFLERKGASGASIGAFAKAKAEHILAVGKAFAALSADERKKLTTLGYATEKTPLVKALKTPRVFPLGPTGLTAEKLKKGLEIAKAQKVNLEASVW